MPSDAIQRIIDADEDAISFSGFMTEPSDELIPRRLAPPMNTLNYYRDFLHGLELVYSQQSGYVDVNGVKTKTVSQALTDALDAAVVGGGGLADTAVAVVPRNSEMVARTQSDKNSDRAHIKDFGAKCDGITDDTLAFKKAVSSLSGTSTVLNLSDTLLITDEIPITKKIRIEGNGALINFSNTSVDTNGNATKCLFRFNDAVFLSANSTQIKSLNVTHTQQTPKNQHTFIFGDAYIIDFVLKDILVRDATGYIIYMQGANKIYRPAFHNPVFDAIRGYNVGGLVGQSETSQLWSAGAGLSRFNIEDKINPTSPSTIIANLKGFRHSVLDNWILEGAGHPTTKIGVYIEGVQNTVNNLYTEITTNKLEYVLDSNSGVTVNNPVAYEENKIRLSMGHSNLNGTTVNNLANKITLTNGATVSVNKGYSSSDYYGSDRPYVPSNYAGLATLSDISSNASCCYSHNPKYDLLKLNQGLYIKQAGSLKTLQNGIAKVELAKFSQDFKVVSSLDSEAGRVTKFVPNAGSFALNALFKITLPNTLYGSQIVVGIRAKLKTTGNFNETNLFNSGIAFPNVGYFVNSSGNITRRIVQVNTKMTELDKWQDIYIIFGGVTGVLEFNLGFFNDVINKTAPIEMHLSDMQISAGKDLPTLSVANNAPSVLRDSAIPEEGYYITGDIIYNNGNLSLDAGWRRKTTGTSNVLGTDWIAF